MTTLFKENFNAYDGLGFSSTGLAGYLDSTNWRIEGLADGTMDFGDDLTVSGATGSSQSSSPNGMVSGGLYGFDKQTGNGINTDIGLILQADTDDLSPGYLTVKITNTTGAELDAVRVNFTALTANDQDGQTDLKLSYSSDDTTYLDTVYAYRTADAKAYVDTSKVFEASQEAVVISGLGLAAGADLYLRWEVDPQSGALFDEVGIDDVQVMAMPSLPEGAQTVTFQEGANGYTGTLDTMVNSNWTLIEFRGLGGIGRLHQQHRFDPVSEPTDLHQHLRRQCGADSGRHGDCRGAADPECHRCGQCHFSL